MFLMLDDLKLFSDKKYLTYIVVHNPKNTKDASDGLEDIIDIITEELSAKQYKDKKTHEIGSLEEEYFNESYCCTENEFNNYIINEFKIEES